MRGASVEADAGGVVRGLAYHGNGVATGGAGVRVYAAEQSSRCELERIVFGLPRSTVDLEGLEASGFQPGTRADGTRPAEAVRALAPCALPYTQACILILYGDDPVASNNILLGQFDIINIPPAPKDVPRIEVGGVQGGKRRAGQGRAGRAGWTGSDAQRATIA